MYNHLLFIIYWAITGVVLYVFNLAFPVDVVLGTYKFSAVESSIYSGFWITFVMWTILDVFYARGFRFDNLLFFFIFSYLANIISIWMIARLASLLGLGITSYQWALFIAIALVILQRIAWQFLGGKENKKKKSKRK